MRAKSLTILAVLLLLPACSKKLPQIGAGNPDEEFKQCMHLSAKNKFEDAVQCLEMFKARYPQTKLGQEAELRIGDAYYAKKDYLLAAESYLAFIKLHPRSPRTDYAHYKAGTSYLLETPKSIDRDQEYLDDAIDHLRILLRRYPESQYRDLAKEKLKQALLKVARRTYYVGNFYFRTGEYIASIPRFMTVGEEFPESGLADKALYKAVIANIRLENIEGAKTAYSALMMKFPSSRLCKQAERKLLAAAKSAEKRTAKR